MHVVIGAALTALLFLTTAAGAEGIRVFRPKAAATGLHGVTGVQALGVQRSGLAELRRRDDARVEAFPLGTDRATTLVLHRITPFPAGARVEVMERGGPRTLPLPDASYFMGRIDGDAGSHVVLVAGRTSVQGFVATGDGDVYPFGPDPKGGHRSYALRDADPSTWPRPSSFCLNDLEPEAVARAPRPLHTGTPPPVVATGTLRIADVAIETDNELRAKFASNQATLDYLTALLAAATAIYERDLGVRLQFSYIRLWAPETTDPWAQTSTTSALYEVQNYWNTPANDMQAIAGQPDLVHFVSGKSVQGGVAYLDVLCNWYWAYGVSQVYGGFNLSDPNGIWDVEVLTHEIGHNFGSSHTHCYSPPLDHCYGSEGTGCYAGPAESSQGTIMSYCHLHSGGLANITLVFGETVSARIGQSVAAASCLALDTGTTTTTTSVTTTTSTTTTSTTFPGQTTTTTTTLVPTTSSSSTTLVSTTSTTSSTLAPTTSTSIASTSTTTTPTTTTTSTTQPPAVPGGCADDALACQCPCSGPLAGGTWRSRGEYLRCVRAAIKAGAAGATSPREALRHAKKSSCGRRQVTRCCVATSLDASTCRIMRASACAAKGLAAEDMGPGSCEPSPCD